MANAVRPVLATRVVPEEARKLARRILSRHAPTFKKLAK
jgi:hypothetical protein